jgi:hypothetical protein
MQLWHFSNSRTYGNTRVGGLSIPLALQQPLSLKSSTYVTPLHRNESLPMFLGATRLEQAEGAQSLIVTPWSNNEKKKFNKRTNAKWFSASTRYIIY